MAASSQQKTIEPRSLYAKAMHPDQLELTREDINGDRFDLSTEMSVSRQYVATLFEMEKKVREKHPGRADVLLAIKAQQQTAIDALVRTTKFARDVENAGEVFTADRVAALLDKVASIIMWRVVDLRDRQNVLDDLNDLMSSFRKSYERGTLVTPDHDALMMDDSIPNSLELVGLNSDNSSILHISEDPSNQGSN